MYNGKIFLLHPSIPRSVQQSLPPFPPLSTREPHIPSFPQFFLPPFPRTLTLPHSSDQTTPIQRSGITSLTFLRSRKKIGIVLNMIVLMCRSAPNRSLFGGRTKRSSPDLLERRLGSFLRGPGPVVEGDDVVITRVDWQIGCFSLGFVEGWVRRRVRRGARLCRFWGWVRVSGNGWIRTSFFRRDVGEMESHCRKLGGREKGWAESMRWRFRGKRTSRIWSVIEV